MRRFVVLTEVAKLRVEIRIVAVRPRNTYFGIIDNRSAGYAAHVAEGVGEGTQKVRLLLRVRCFGIKELAKRERCTKELALNVVACRSIDIS